MSWAPVALQPPGPSCPSWRTPRNRAPSLLDYTPPHNHHLHSSAFLLPDLHEVASGTFSEWREEEGQGRMTHVLMDVPNHLLQDERHDLWKCVPRTRDSANQGSWPSAGGWGGQQDSAEKPPGAMPWSTVAPFPEGHICLAGSRERGESRSGRASTQASPWHLMLRVDLLTRPRAPRQRFAEGPSLWVVCGPLGRRPHCSPVPHHCAQGLCARSLPGTCG